MRKTSRNLRSRAASFLSIARSLFSRWTRAAVVAGVAIGLLLSAAPTVALGVPPGSKFWEANGHYYQLVENYSLSWEGARIAAEARSEPGVRAYLVTVTSQAEEVFLREQFGGGEILIGGFQPANADEPDSGWRWVTEEPWDYENWGPGEPNDTNGEDFLWLANNAFWNDINERLIRRYVVEYEPDPVENLTPAYYALDRLTSGAAVYSDDPLLFANQTVPEYQRAYYIRTRAADAASTGSALIQFDLLQAATIHVAFDARVEPLPSWLEWWRETEGAPEIAGEEASARRTFWKRFTPGPVLLGGNLPEGASGSQPVKMYAPIIVQGTQTYSNPTAPSLFPDNGHYYELVKSAYGQRWGEARFAAEARSYRGGAGFLASVTSREEYDFVAAHVLSLRVTQGSGSVFLGGYQPAGSPEPSGGWRWLTEEPWSFDNWNAGEPSNSGGGGGESVLEVLEGSDKWNDRAPHVRFPYFVVEYVPTLNPIVIEPNYPIKDLRAGQTVYQDEPNLFHEPMPKYLLERPYIQTREADRNSTASAFLRFEIDSPSVIYVGLDAGRTAPPAWMSAWRRAPGELVTDDTVPFRTLYSKRFEPGEIVLGANRDAGSSEEASMYSVVLGSVLPHASLALSDSETLYDPNPTVDFDLTSGRRFEIEGSALDVDDDASDFAWTLGYRPVGGEEWTELTSSSASIYNALLYDWRHDYSIPPGDYTLRLTATNEAGATTDTLLVSNDLERPDRPVSVTPADGSPDVSRENVRFQWESARASEYDLYLGKQGHATFQTQTLAEPSIDLTALDTGDIDGDGDLDVIALAKADNSILWFENPGAKNATFAVHVALSDFASPNSFDLGDFDNDGDLDVVAASEELDTVFLLLNDGSAPPSFALTTQVIPDLAVRFVSAAHFDQDGWMDIACGGLGFPPIVSLKNTGADPLEFQAQSIFPWRLTLIEQGNSH